VTDLLEVARAQGFARLLGPLVPERLSGPYLDAGLRIVERVVVMRLDLRAREHAREGARAGTTKMPTGLTIREADRSDIAVIMRIDDACFEPFWRYDRAGLERLARTGRIALGTLDGRDVGYTLATSRAGDGSLGRLAVTPDARRRGIGRALADDAVAWMVRQGARGAVLSTQEDNTASRSLYRAMGFAETGDVLVACASSSLLREPCEGR
jgi:ribosomal-protein-alanine N-acetyltransferase